MKFEQIQKKKERLSALRPLPPELVANLDGWFRVELTYTSNAIEGNTLTRRETALVVEKGLTVGGKTLVEHLEASNHAHALDWVKARIDGRPAELQERDVLTIHEMILEGIDATNAGRYRNVPVRISGSRVVLPNPAKVPILMSEFANWLGGENKLHPVEFAIEVHYRLVTIHPFADGNGRTARLLMNMILMMHGFPPAIIRKSDRLAYVGSLEKAQLGGSRSDYENLVCKAIDRSLDIYLKAAEGREEQLEDEGRLFKIGELAKRAGTTVATIRYWTKEGLLTVADTTDSGYQLYAEGMLKQIERINQLKKQRLSIQEIREKLA